MNEEITVSVVMTSYNHEKYIAKAIQSVLSQNFSQSFELLIGDDCSSDGTAKIIRQFAENDSRVVPYIREKNMGSNLNSVDLMKRCKGKYICFLEGDDFWIDEEKLQKQTDWLDSHEECYSVAARYAVCDEFEKELSRDKYTKPVLVTKTNYLQMDMPHIGTIMIRNGNYLAPTRGELFELLCFHSIVSDWSLFLFMVDRSDFYIMPDVVHCWRRVISKNASNYGSLIRYKLNRYDVINERMQYEQKLNDFPFERIKTNYRAYDWAKQLWAYLLLDFHKESRMHGKEVLKTNFYPIMTRGEKMKLPFGVIGFYFKALAIKIKAKIKALKK